MATLCDQCGHKTNEVKSGGGIEPTGKKMILSVENEQDLSRDLLKVRRVLDKVCQYFLVFFLILKIMKSLTLKKNCLEEFW